MLMILVHPFVRMFYGSPSEYLWEDNEGNVHSIPQGEGDEQGDAMMPLLFCLGQQEALQAVHRQLQAGERLFAYLDDVYVVTRPERVVEVYRILEEALRVFSCIRIHNGRRRFGTSPVSVQWRVTGQSELRKWRTLRATVWKGGRVPTNEQGTKVLGTPLGHDDFVAHHLREVAREQQELLDKIPLVKNLQSAWLLLLHCAAAGANYQLRSVRPSATEEYAKTATLLGTDLGQCTVAVRELATLPIRLGGLGLTSAVRIRGSAHWGS